MAQLVARFIDIEKVIGSNPIGPTTLKPYNNGKRFSLFAQFGPKAHPPLAEVARFIDIEKVIGSNPIGPTKSLHPTTDPTLKCRVERLGEN